VEAVDLDTLAHDVAELMLDLPSFGAMVEIPTKGIGGKVPFGWDRWHPEQRRFERDRTGRDIVLKPRQIGFSMLELCRDLQFARTHEGVQVVVVVHTGEAKNELFSRVHVMVRALARWGLMPDPKENTKTGLRWADNDSSIKIIEAGKDEGTAAARGRSGTIHRLHATEVAFYAQPEETMTALLAAAGDHGEVVIESTANGVDNWFHERVLEAREGRFENFAFHFYPWWQHPTYRAPRDLYPAPTSKREQFWEKELRKLGCTEEQIAWWRKTVSTHKLDKALREYPPTVDAAFTVSSEKWLSPEHVDRLRAHVREPLEHMRLERSSIGYGELRVYERPQPGLTYIAAVDPSAGVGINEAAITVIEQRSGAYVAAWNNTRVKPGELGHVAAMVGRYYNNALVAVERNVWRDNTGNDREGGLETIAVLEREERYPRIYRDAKTSKVGWSTNEHTRPLIFGDLAKGIEDPDDPLTTPDARTVDEAAALVLTPRGPRAPRKAKGRGDDGLFVTWGIARQIRNLVPLPGKVVARPVGRATISSGFAT
jgi:hypothetical protein